MPTHFGLETNWNERQTVQASGFDKNDKIFYVGTERTVFAANDLTEVMLLWKNSGDTSKVISIDSLG